MIVSNKCETLNQKQANTGNKIPEPLGTKKQKGGCQSTEDVSNKLFVSKRGCRRKFVAQSGKQKSAWKKRIKRMNGIKGEYGYPVLKDGKTTAVKDEEKVVGKNIC